MAGTQRRPPAEPARATPAEAGEPAGGRARTVCVGRLVGAHGVRGIVRVQSHTANPDHLTAYGTLSDAGGTRRFALTVTGHVRGLVLARVEGVDDRDQAEALRGTDLYAPRRRRGRSPSQGRAPGTPWIGRPRRTSVKS